jgi:arsenite methyltransferase
MAGIAKQLGHPRGVGGRIVGLALNRGNRGFVSAAVQALQAADDAVVVDTLHGAGFTVRDRRINSAAGAPHLLIGTPRSSG